MADIDPKRAAEVLRRDLLANQPDNSAYVDERSALEYAAALCEREAYVKPTLDAAERVLGLLKFIQLDCDETTFSQFDVASDELRQALERVRKATP